MTVLSSRSVFATMLATITVVAACSSVAPITESTPTPTPTPKANGEPCSSAADCLSATCTAGTCAPQPTPPSCSDALKNGNEADVDCGGSCAAKCANGSKCTAAGDCVSATCASGICVAPTCADGSKNGLESDVDCGPSCAKCADGKACGAAADCASGVCTAGKCAAPSCSDTVKNGSETDLNCGGTCPKCGDGKACAAALDCTSGVCTGNVCQAPACNDTVKNAAETDVDCGGGTCPKCAAGKTCVAAGDCLSGGCTGGVCAQYPHNFNVLDKKDITYSGIDYVLLKVSLNTNNALGDNWCTDYLNLCQTYGALPTGCGSTYTSGGYGVCKTTYQSDGTSNTLGCNASGGVSAAAVANGYADADTTNSFAFHYCDVGAGTYCFKTWCSGTYCSTALSYYDITKPHAYTLCKKP